MQYRGRAALKRRVKRLQKKPGFSPRGKPVLRALCEEGCPERSRRAGFHNPIPLRIWQALRPGRARRQPCRKQPSRTHAVPWKSGASAPRKAATKKEPGFSPRGKPVLRALCEEACAERSRRVGFHNPIPLRIRKAPRPGRVQLQSHRKPITTTPCSDVEERRLSAA